MKNKINYMLLGAGIIAAAAAAAYFFFQYQNVRQQLANPANFSQAETKAVIEKLGKIIELPADETPTVATISDRDKLRNQPFFAHAKNGDKVIIYTNAKKAILYDPIANKIIDVAPVNIGTNSATPAASAAAAKVALYNGTANVGLTQTAEKMLKGKLTDAEVVLKDNAKKNDYPKTLVVNLTGNNVAANLVAKAFGAEMAKFPDGEEKPLSSGNGPVDILVILGKDFIR